MYFKISFNIIIFLTYILTLNITQASTSYDIGVVPAKVSYYNFYDQYSAVGQCILEKSRTYNANIDGKVDSTAITQGQYVKEGDTIITIDQSIARADKSEAESSFNEAKSVHNRDVSLLSKNIISRETADKSKVALETAKAKLASANDLYKDHIIAAPFDGYIGVINALVGDEIKKGDYLFSLLAESNKIIFITLPERLFNKINQKSRVFVHDREGKKAYGSVIAVSKYINNDGLITVKLSFPYNTNIIHGAYVKATLIFDQHRALGLPEESILKNNHGSFVYQISKQGIIEQLYIETGLRTDDFMEIKSGKVVEGDLVVIGGLTKIAKGSKVKILKKNNKDNGQ